MSPRRASLLLLPLLASALAGCGQEAARAAEDRADPVIALALADPLMTDPDLASRNMAGLGLRGEGVPSALVPRDESDEKARAAALADASALMGGQAKAPPPAVPGMMVAAGQTALLSWQGRFPQSRCADAASWGFIWAARMPQWLPVYPRGHVQEALGADTAECHARALSFRSAVGVQDIIDFYAAMTGKAGFALKRGVDGEAQVLSGSKGGSGFAVHARPGPEGMTAVDLVSLGS